MLKPVVHIVTIEFCLIHTSFRNILGFQLKNLQRYLLYECETWSLVLKGGGGDKNRLLGEYFCQTGEEVTAERGASGFILFSEYYWADQIKEN
jgi:hypothetical protein